MTAGEVLVNDSPAPSDLGKDMASPTLNAVSRPELHPPIETHHGGIAYHLHLGLGNSVTDLRRYAEIMPEGFP